MFAKWGRSWKEVEKKHLKLQHKEPFKKFEEEQNEKLSPTLYPKDSKPIIRKLALFVGSTNVPLCVVDCPEFRDLLTEMDCQYNIPYRKKLGQEIDQVYSDLQHNIFLVLEQTKRISICCDIWSKQGMTASFLGVTIHCFTVHDKKRHSITLAVNHFEQPHTTERIAELLQSVFDQWDIPRHKVFCSLTDKGSNMVKAFQTDEKKVKWSFERKQVG